MCGLRQHLRLMPLKPIGLGLGLEVLDDRTDAQQRKEHPPQPGQSPTQRRPTLVRPNDGRSQRLTQLV